MINNTFTFQLIPAFTFMLIVDILWMYLLFLFILKTGMSIEFYLVMISYISKHFILRILVSHVGSSTSNEPQQIIETMSKLMNEIPDNDTSRMILQNYMRQFQARNFEIKTLFLKVNWDSFFGVSKKL